jgi:hypothetical protein
MYTLSSWDMKSQRQNSDHCQERHLGNHSGLATPMKAGPVIVCQTLSQRNGPAATVITRFKELTLKALIVGAPLKLLRKANTDYRDPNECQ